MDELVKNKAQIKDMKAEAFVIENVMVIDGKDMVAKEDAYEALNMAYNDAVKKWTMWCFNYSTPFERIICNIWGGTLSYENGRYCCNDNYFTQHLIEKWQSFEPRRDARMLFFYCDLDNGLRKQLVDWVMENYEG